jgi:hypothetical protein
MNTGRCADHTGKGMANQNRRTILPFQHEPSANSPSTRTTLRAFSAVAFAAMPRVEISDEQRSRKGASVHRQDSLSSSEGLSWEFLVARRRHRGTLSDAGMFDLVSSFTAFLALLMRALGGDFSGRK